MSAINIRESESAKHLNSNLDHFSSSNNLSEDMLLEEKDFLQNPTIDKFL